MYSESASQWVLWVSESHGLADSHVQCVGKEQSIPAVNISGASPRVRESMSPQSAEYIRPTDSVERPTIHSVPSSSGRSGSTLSGGAAHHNICPCFSNPLLLCTLMPISDLYCAHSHHSADEGPQNETSCNGIFLSKLHPSSIIWCCRSHNGWHVLGLPHFCGPTPRVKQIKVQRWCRTS